MFRTLGEAMLKGRGREVPFLCPVHDDLRPSASLNRYKGIYYCYACGASGSADEVLDSEGMRFAAEIDELLGTEPRIYSEAWLDQFDQVPSAYWRGRFSASCAEEFRLGHDHSAGTPTYPIRDPAGRVLGVVRRSLLSDGPKYLYPRGVAKSSLLHGYERARCGEQVVVVEGAPDVWACHEVGVTALGLYGSVMSNEQIRLLHRLEPSRVLLALDNDIAGREATYGRFSHHLSWRRGILDRLGDEGLDVVAVSWGGLHGKDVADLDVTSRHHLLNLVAP